MSTAIIYSTKYGTVEKASKILSSKLTGNVTLVNLKKNKVPDLNQFDTVILGGSIYIGKIQKAMTKFVNSNLPLLLTKRVGLFICAAQPEEDIRQKELTEAFPQELFRHAVAREIFGHEFCIEKLNFLDRFIMKKVQGVTESVYQLSEEKIEGFAKVLNE